jgi:predicted nucleic acid-binding protein
MKSRGLPVLTNENAWRVYRAILSDSRIGFAVEPSGTEAQWESYANRKTASPKLWMDAYLAAFATAGKYGFVTTDHGFTQFKGLEPVILGDIRTV